VGVGQIGACHEHRVAAWGARGHGLRAWELLRRAVLDEPDHAGLVAVQLPPGTEVVLGLRNPAAAFFTFAFPVILVLVFGTIFTVIIALEFKRSLLVLAERSDSVVQVRAVVLIALLAVVRKLIILDLSTTDAFHLLALAAAILALGAVYWLVRDQGRRGFGVSG